MKARRVLEAWRIVRATIPMLPLVRALRKITVQKTTVRKITGPFLVLAPRRTVRPHLNTIVPVRRKTIARAESRIVLRRSRTIGERNRKTIGSRKTIAQHRGQAIGLNKHRSSSSGKTRT